MTGHDHGVIRPVFRKPPIERGNGAGALHALTLAEQLFRILFGFSGNVASGAKFIPCSTEEDSMKKIGYVIAALAAIAIAAPSIASAETVVVEGGHHHHGWHRDWHPHHHHDVMVIKHRHHDY